MSENKAYVVGFAFSADHQKVLLITKAKPDWQAGKLNGVGGQIEDLESDHEAMNREFWEECCVDVPEGHWRRFGVMLGGPALPFRVEMLSTVLSDEELAFAEASTAKMEEPVRIYAVDQIAKFPVVENLLWMVHLAIDNLQDGRPTFTRIEY